MPDGARGSRNQSGTDFWSLGASARLLDAPTGPGSTAGTSLTFGDVVAIDFARHGLERAFFHSILNAEQCKTFTVQCKSFTVQ